MSVLIKAAQTIEVLGASENPTRLSDICDSLDLPKSSVHRLLNELVDLGLVNKCPDGGYAVGHRLLRWGQYAESYVGLRSLATPIIRRLRDLTGYTVILAVPAGPIRTIVAVEPGRSMRPVMLPVGHQGTLGLGASGKILYAYATDQVKEQALQLLTDHERELLCQPVELSAIVEQGWASSFGEMEPDVAGVSVPILSRKQCVGALVLAGSVENLTLEAMADVLQPMREVADQIAREALGNQT